jgi:hypothetical protein
VVTLFLRLGLGWMNHSVYTAITGAAFGYSRSFHRGSPARWLLPLGGYVIAATLHNSFNFLATLLAYLLPDTLIGLLLAFIPLYGITWTAMAVLGYLAIRGWHQQADLMRALLPEEVDRGVITPKEYFALPSGRGRKALLREALATVGPIARRAQGKIFQLAISLAWQRRRTALGDAPGVPLLHGEDALRRRILELRPLLSAVPAPAAPLPVAAAQPVALAYPHQGYPDVQPTIFAPPHDPARSAVAPASPPSAALSPDARGYQLVVTSGHSMGRTVLLHNGLTIGRNPRLAFLVLPDPEVSSLHARIARDGGPPILIDANSTNGTYVNGERITNRPLQPGDSITIGGVQLVVEAIG